MAQAFLPLLSDIEHLLPNAPPLLPLTPLDPELEKRRRFETLAHFLICQTLAHPVLLVVEDLHWSDDIKSGIALLPGTTLFLYLSAPLSC